MIDFSRDTQWYERRKRRLILATLGCERYGRVFEPGCGAGALTAELAPRCKTLLALDQDEASILRALERTASMPHVTCLQRNLPREWPHETPFDLIVLSEWLYYIDDADRSRVADLVDGSLAAHGELIACHWRHPIPECEVTALNIHAALGKRIRGLTATVVDDEDFLVHRWRRSPLSVAQQAGLRP